MRTTNSLVRIAVVILEHRDEQLWGYQLSQETGVRSGVLYPTLHRMLDQGWLTDGWEQIDPVVEKRRPRRYYELTDKGVRELGAVVVAARADKRFAPLKEGWAW